MLQQNDVRIQAMQYDFNQGSKSNKASSKGQNKTQKKARGATQDQDYEDRGGGNYEILLNDDKIQDHDRLSIKRQIAEDAT